MVARVVTTSGSVTTSTAGCADNRSVVLITIDGGGHHWPDFATQKLWQFFARSSPLSITGLVRL
jgi:polyhydroxybutyrate depolymerase